MKVHELAKELNIPSKEVITKAKGLGVELTNHMSTIAEDNVDAVRMAIGGNSASETKIVKATPKRKSTEEDEVHVTVKAAKVIPATKAKSSSKPQSSKSGDSARSTNTEKSGGAAKAPVPGKPKRVPAEQVKRIPKEDLEATKSESEENKVVEKKPLKVAHQDKGELKPKTQEGSTPDKTVEKKPERKPLKVAFQDQEEYKPKKKEEATSDKKPEKKFEKKPEKVEKAPERKPRKELKVAYKDKEPLIPPKKKDEPKKAETQPKGENKTAKSTKPAKPANKPDNRQNKSPEKKTDKGSKPQQSGAPKKDNKNKPKKKDNYRKDDRNKKKGKYVPISLEKRSNKPKNRPKPKPAPEPEQDLLNVEELAPGTKIINVPITVAGFAEQTDKTTSEVIMALMKLGIMANINQNIDEETVVILGEELGVEVVIGQAEEEIVDEGLETFEDKEEDLVKRPPIITVMGHVDHGKTSLLDAIRKTNVTEGEAGGITQHIGASEVTINDEKIVFLDTPGHEAFTAMRARGAHVTDIAVLVVAADDSVKPQTIESISHAKAAGVPIIVAINKVDKPGANLDKVKQDLADKGILVEDWGGETISVPVSAKTGEGIVSLLEMILLQAEVLELRANPNRQAQGTVLEARLDKAKGPVTSLLVLNGTLDAGHSIVAGTTSGRIRAMVDDKGQSIQKAGPATAVEVLGLSDVPQAGDGFHSVKDDKLAREIAENRRDKLREEIMGGNQAGMTLESLFGQIKDGETKELNLIIKGDVQGSVGALTTSLEKLKNENVNVRIIHTGVGTVTESDVTLASTSGAIIIGFNVRPTPGVTKRAEDEDVEIRTYRVIYDVIDDVESAMKGMLDPEFKEVVLGTIEIRETFKVPNAGVIGGAYVTTGKVLRNAQVRLIRDGIVIHEGKISSLKRFKDDVREVAQGYECGIGLENYNDIKVGDIVEAFTMEEVKR